MPVKELGRSVARLFAEAKRRRVYIAVVAYVAVGAGIIELAGPLTEALLLPEWTPRLVTVLTILGLPVVLVLAWIFDITSEGIRRTSAVADTPGVAGAPRGSRAPAPALPPLPDLPKRRRRPSRTQPELTETEPDPDRVRQAALAHVRHELRTPINGILGYGEMVLEEADDPEIARDTERILDAGRRLLSMVDEVVDPASAGVNLDDGGALEAFGARIRADLRTPVNAVIGYSEMLLEAAEEKARDDLAGDLERIRDAANRLLALSEDIVKVAALGPDGEAVLDGSLGRTSTLTREVMAKVRPMDGERGGLRVDGEGRVLVVDDNSVNRDLLARGLARAGYMVATAEDGAGALDHLAEQSFDVVLLDLIMPGMDGLETLRRIRDEDRLADVPVIMLSSLDEVDSVVHCIELGAEEYLVKPVPTPILEARIAANVELKQMRSLGRRYHERIRADEAFIERLLAGAFPSRLAERFRAGDIDVQERFAETTALCCLFAGGASPATDLSSAYPVLERLANEGGIDMCVWRPGRFLAVAGAAGGGGHAQLMADLALSMVDEESSGLSPLRPRVGLHTGPAAGGILGRDRFGFDLWGEAVELAEGLARKAPEAGIALSPTTHGILRDTYRLDGLGIAELSGRGQMRVYSLRGRLSGHGSDAAGG